MKFFTHLLPLIVTSGFSIGLSAFAADISVPRSSQDLCELAKTPGAFQELALNVETRMNFENHGGLANGGVCWWHSRFQRSALYLTSYRPDLPAPTDEEAKKIIKAIKKQDGFIVIPGFRNFADFSDHYANQIQEVLEKWQTVDGFLKMTWIKGLSGSSHNSPDNLKQKMEELYERISNDKQVVYQKLQLKGITAHAWLVIGMTQRSDGYEVFYIDSNFPRSTMRLNYQYGDRSLATPDYGDFVAYTEESDELKAFNRIFRKECQLKLWKLVSE